MNTNILNACRNLSEPFTKRDLREASGANKWIAASQVNRWAQAGMLEKTGYGQYKRTEKFPLEGAVIDNGAPRRKQHGKKQKAQAKAKVKKDVHANFCPNCGCNMQIVAAGMAMAQI